ncbi:MAG TPA: alpha-amylase/4-alpha-glucanotransferase domain-containing protein, partial [Treponemataceae bacterium]|nr:alpha-amylase/4-alpha-glucanotransferase domain-containing protein [Treponemataceae bacterium]
SNKKDQLALTKKYAFTENGILVQYILQNNSDKDIKGFFAVENNFSIPFTHKKNIIIEVLVDKKRCCPSYNEKYIEKEHVSLLQITDANAKNSFVLEPNENAGLFLEPLFSARPLIDSEDIPRLEANSAVFFWDITIPAAKEIEKNIYLGINTAKKKPVAKKTRKQ